MECAESMDFTESRSEKLYREDRTVNLDKAMERTKKALDGALVEYEMRWFDNGPVIAVPSFGAGRIASIVQTSVRAVSHESGNRRRQNNAHHHSYQHHIRERSECEHLFRDEP